MAAGPQPGMPCPPSRGDTVSRPTLEHGAPSYSLARAGQAAPKARPEVRVFPEHLRAEPALPSRPEQAPGKACALPAPGEQLMLTAGGQNYQFLYSTNNPFEDFLPPSLPCVKGSCRLNYNIFNCANSS